VCGPSGCGQLDAALKDLDAVPRACGFPCAACTVHNVWCRPVGIDREGTQDGCFRSRLSRPVCSGYRRGWKGWVVESGSVGRPGERWNRMVVSKRCC